MAVLPHCWLRLRQAHCHAGQGERGGAWRAVHGQGVGRQEDRWIVIKTPSHRPQPQHGHRTYQAISRGAQPCRQAPTCKSSAAPPQGTVACGCGGHNLLPRNRHFVPAPASPHGAANSLLEQCKASPPSRSGRGPHRGPPQRYRRQPARCRGHAALASVRLGSCHLGVPTSWHLAVVRRPAAAFESAAGCGRGGWWVAVKVAGRPCRQAWLAPSPGVPLLHPWPAWPWGAGRGGAWGPVYRCRP